MSTSDPTNIWAWVYEDAEQLNKAGGEGAAMVARWREFEHYHHNNYTAADQAIGEALQAARALGNRRWELFLRHWRLQLWLDGDVRHALPEAVDLLNLATDERVRDVPQRICAFHDVVDCHVLMDAAGYHDDIVANSQDVLAQLPARHPCADCARMHLATAAGAAQRAEDADHWVAQFNANVYGKSWSAWPNQIGWIYEQLGRWDDAKQAYERACKLAREGNTGDHYVEGLLGIARACAAQGDAQGAVAALRDAQHTAKYTGGASELARLMEVEGYVAEAVEEPKVALGYFTRAAQQYLDLGRYRHAALAALHGVEMAREKNVPSAEDALAIAARAVGAMPAASTDTRTRLAHLGAEPVPPAPERVSGAEGQASGMVDERAVLESALAAHLASGNARGVALALYRLARWHADHEAPRAAVDYFIANAVLERMLQLTMNDREDALDALQHLRETLPAGAVEAALAAAESEPPPMLAPLLEGLPAPRWRWLVRSVASEVEGRPVVEPEPHAADGSYSFEEWLDHVASMAALIVRAGDRADRAQCERWAVGLDETAADMQERVPEDQGRREVLSLVTGLAALCRGTNPQEVIPTVLPPFNQIVEQIIALAGEPVWQHPGNWPLDFLVENAAQRAVGGLRLHDEHRATRLANLGFRFDLMALDLNAQERLRPIGAFLQALSQLVRADGDLESLAQPPLEEPFDAVLAAVAAAGKAEGEPDSQ
jgi:tetratricopeptide (TPR) repeat protein